MELPGDGQIIVAKAGAKLSRWLVAGCVAEARTLSRAMVARAGLNRGGGGWGWGEGARATRSAFATA